MLKMKKLIALLLCLVLAVGALAGCSGGTSNTPAGSPAASPAASPSGGEPASPAPSSDGKVYECVFNSTDLETTCNSQIVLAWEEEVTEASDGRIQFVNYWSGALASSPESIDAVKNGVVDLTFFITSIYPGVIVGANVMSAPGLGLTFDENGAMACWEVFSGYEPITKEFDGMKLLGCSTNGGFSIFNSARPIKALSDFTGLRIRINNSMTEGFLQYLGATPVSFNFGDTYENIEKNVCDGTMMDWDALYKMRIFEVAPYVVDTEGLCSTTTAIVMNPEDGEICSYQIPYSAGILVGEGDHVDKGQELTAGALSPHDVLRIRGVDDDEFGRPGVRTYLIQEVLKVYRQQGVDINDKHIEVIVRQMMRKVRVEDPGDTALLSGATVDVFEYRQANAELQARIDAGEKNELGEELRPATCTQILLGITKASLATDSWMSAASFQETTKVLTDAAIKGKVDHLVGLKENVIIGKLIPAGSGLEQYRNVETDMDEEIDASSADYVDLSVLVGRTNAL